MSSNKIEQSNNPIVDVKEEVHTQINNHRRWYRSQAILFIILGLVSLIVPYATAIAVNLILGMVLIIAGVSQFYAAYKTESRIVPSLSGILSLVTGSLLIVFPISGALAVGLIIAIFLLFEGLLEIMVASGFRPEQGWGWLMLSGVFSIILSILVINGWPGTTLFFYGIFISLNLLLFGVSMLALTRYSGSQVDA